MSLLQSSKRNDKNRVRTATINNKVINFITEYGVYGEFIHQWEIDGVDIAPINSKYTGDPITLACCNGLIGTRDFNRSIKLECLYEVIGWEDKIIQIEKEVEAAKMEEIWKNRPDAKAENYDFTFTIGQKLDYILMKIAREQKES